MRDFDSSAFQCPVCDAVHKDICEGIASVLGIPLGHLWGFTTFGTPPGYRIPVVEYDGIQGMQDEDGTIYVEHPDKDDQIHRFQKVDGELIDLGLTASAHL